MVFTELRFLIFFLIAFALHWTLRGNSAKKNWLLLSSYFFYGSWDWKFCSLILASTIVDYFCGIAIESASGKRGRTLWLLLSVFVNLGFLGFFKYFNFFIENGVGFLNLLGMDVGAHRLEIVLPVGISFYTFQSLSYSIDVFRGELKAVRSFRDFALFVSFFPQLVAGPIVRAVQFLPQLDVAPKIQDVVWRPHLTLFLFGFIKKACVADNLGSVVDAVFANPSEYGTAAKWIAAGLFNVQLYCDFSGYSDMAIATAGMLGYRLAINFDFPFVGTSVAEFWRRWHISLTSWIRDYLYIWLDWVWIRLGGSKRSRWRVYFALFGVYTAVGFWHGASWNFVLFGANAGLWVVLEAAGFLRGVTSRKWLAYPYVYLFWTLSAVLFRSGPLENVGDFLIGLVGVGSGEGVVELAYAAVLPAFLIAHVAMYKRFLHRPFERLPNAAYAVVYGAAWALVFPWVATGPSPFIYFQF